jgi:hypothetical protein
LLILIICPLLCLLHAANFHDHNYYSGQSHFAIAVTVAAVAIAAAAAAAAVSPCLATMVIKAYKHIFFCFLLCLLHSTARGGTDKIIKNNLLILLFFSIVGSLDIYVNKINPNVQ